jgi:hypothetical protein
MKVADEAWVATRLPHRGTRTVLTFRFRKLNQEPERENWEQSLRIGFNQHVSHQMSVAHLGEVFYHVWPDQGEAGARRAINELLLMAVQPIDVDGEQALKAGEIEARHNAS